ncbi:hypothetical protein GGH93_005712 [Coemansia aciculifera]|nr:hypothetical protein GGH93_005712 [Coemansia aciculifera]
MNSTMQTQSLTDNYCTSFSRKEWICEYRRQQQRKRAPQPSVVSYTCDIFGLCQRWRVNKALNAAKVPPLSKAELMLSDGDWSTAAAPGIVRAGVGVVNSTLDEGDRVRIECSDVVDNAMSFELRAGQNIMLGVAACSASDVEAPVTSGILDHIISAMNRHVHRQVNVRHAWALILGPSRVRVCYVEYDAIHFSAVRYTTNSVGRRLLGAAVTYTAFAEPPELGSDPSMKLREDIQRWEIDCPDPDDADQVVYTPRDPEFISYSFFGRQTICLPVAPSPVDTKFKYMVKDSWQLVPVDLEDAELLDEIGVLRSMRDALDTAQCTVRVNNIRASSRLVLGAELDSYARWTVPHGATGDTTFNRIHRRTLSNPVGMPLYKLHDEKDAAAAVAAPGGLGASQDTVSRPQGITMPPPGFLWARRADPLAVSSPKRRGVF